VSPITLHFSCIFQTPPDLNMLFALLGVLATVALAQQSGKDPVLDVCRRHLHQTCVIDSRLYIDGGLAYYGGSIDNNSIAESSK
jgi:hypothetical protein